MDIEEEEEIKKLFTTLYLKPGKYFLEEGKICGYVGFIASGLVRYFIIYCRGAFLTIAMLGLLISIMNLKTLKSIFKSEVKSSKHLTLRRERK